MVDSGFLYLYLSHMLKIENVSKSYGSQVLFRDVTVNINRGERVGLVGRNGHGKTTLLRLITGEEEADSGAVSVPRGYRVGYLEQRIEFTRPTILEEAASGLREGEEDLEWKAEKVLSGLGFSQEDMGRDPENFSGGFQVRLQLARLLVSDPDLLLLDEPTNFLDVVALRWLERFFLTWPGELLLVTHDRTFMDAVTTHILGIHRFRVRKIKGDTAKYYGQIAMEEEVHEKSRINIEKKRRQTEQFIRKFRAKARLVGLVQSRIRTLEKQKVPERLEAIATLDFNFRAAPFEGKVLMEARDLGFGWSPGSGDLFSELDLVIGQGDRIGVVGPNGLGKSTLLRLLAGDLSPTRGTVSSHPGARPGFFGQTNVERLDPDRTVVEELLAADPDRSLTRARAVSGTMMFEGDAALKCISVLSGGERSRVLLGRLLLEPHNILLLDEPTNHLDMDSAEALLDALVDFDGAVVIVTHNEMYLHSLAEKLLIFDRGGATLFEGSYANFLEDVGWQSEEEGDEREGGQRATGRESKREARRERARKLQERTRESAPLQKRVSDLEEEISRLEARAGQVSEGLVDASTSGDGARIAELSRELSALESGLEERYRDLVEATEALEELRRKWDT